MKTVSAALLTSLQGSRAHYVVDIFELALPVGNTTSDGATLRWTTAAVDIVYGGNTYDAARQAGAQAGDNARPVIRSSYSRLGDGVEVGQVELFLAGGAEVISGMTIPALALQGAFEWATLTVTRFFLSDPLAANPTTPDPNLAVTLFKGYVDTVEPGLETRLVVKSNVGRLTNSQVPSRNLQGLCPWVLYDSNTCQASANGTGANPQTTTVASATATVVLLTSDVSGVGGQVMVYDTVTGTYYGGKLALSRRLELGAVMPIPLPAGRSIKILRSCDKTRKTCINRFNNLVHFGGSQLVADQGN